MLSIELNPDKLLNMKIPNAVRKLSLIKTNKIKKTKPSYTVLTLQERRSDPQVHTKPRQIINHLVLY